MPGLPQSDELYDLIDAKRHANRKKPKIGVEDALGFPEHKLSQYIESAEDLARFANGLVDSHHRTLDKLFELEDSLVRATEKLRDQVSDNNATIQKLNNIILEYTKLKTKFRKLERVQEKANDALTAGKRATAMLAASEKKLKDAEKELGAKSLTISQQDLELKTLRKGEKDLRGELQRTKKELEMEQRRFYRDERESLKRQRMVQDKQQRTSAWFQMNFGTCGVGPTGTGIFLQQMQMTSAFIGRNSPFQQNSSAHSGDDYLQQLFRSNQQPHLMQHQHMWPLQPDPNSQHMGNHQGGNYCGPRDHSSYFPNPVYGDYQQHYTPNGPNYITGLNQGNDGYNQWISSQPHQPNHHPNPQPNQPNHYPNQPSYQPNPQQNQPNHHPNQPSYQGNQTPFQPNQPMHQASQQQLSHQWDGRNGQEVSGSLHQPPHLVNEQQQAHGTVPETVTPPSNSPNPADGRMGALFQAIS